LALGLSKQHKPIGGNMSTELTIRITEEAEKKQLNMEVKASQDNGTELEKAIVTRLKPYIEACLDGFEGQVIENEKRNEEIEAAEQSRIILP
jgi:hypothetical protein